MPTLHIIAGPNGVGKTTFADEYLPDEIKQLEFVNADPIARGLSPYDPDAVAIEAGKMALKRIKELIAENVSFTWETTMKWANSRDLASRSSGDRLYSGNVLPFGSASGDDNPENTNKE